MDRWRLGFEEYDALPIGVEADMLLVMAAESEVAGELAKRTAKLPGSR